MALKRQSSNFAFTLVEVLAALLIIGIVLPTVMYGISLATNVASRTRHRIEATTLAQDKLNELLVTGDWENGLLAGDFGEDYPEYRWEGTLNAWYPTGQNQDLRSITLMQLEIKVLWMQRNQQDNIAISTLMVNLDDITVTSSTQIQNGTTSGGGGGR